MVRTLRLVLGWGMVADRVVHSGQWCCHTVWWCQVSGQAGVVQVTRPVTVSFTVKYFTVPATSYLLLTTQARGG